MTTSADSYDPAARRQTPLARKLVAHIRRDGPIPVDQYMKACLYDPEHGYYVTRPAIGAAADFTTAPEISQVFGELIGLWCAVVWQQMGSPKPFDLVEYGPGRGTMMADALRAVSRVPGFLDAARVRLIEVSPVLRQIQRDKLERGQVPGSPDDGRRNGLVPRETGTCPQITWHEQLAGRVEPAPSILIANEVLDAAVVEQCTGKDQGIAGIRCVTVDDAGRLQFCTRIENGGIEPDRTDIVEIRELHPMIAQDMKALPSAAALLIDYGHTASRNGDTLQAVRNHRFEHPLTSPGEADLTAQVDFELFAGQCGVAGFAIDGPVTQAEFLGALGISQRASRLMTANPTLAGQIEISIARLMSPTGMGTHFKAIGVRTPDVAPLPGLTPASAHR